MRNLKSLMIVAIAALIVFCLPASAAEPNKKPKEKKLTAAQRNALAEKAAEQAEETVEEVAEEAATETADHSEEG